MNHIEELLLEQGSEAWKEARLGWPTASELSSLMAKGEGKTRARYMRQLAAEALTGRSAATFAGNAYTERGTELEPTARELLAEELGREIRQTGVIRNHAVGLSCSPDGLIGDDEMAEFKCPADITHIEWLMRGLLPAEHVLQVQGSLLVTGRKVCWFQSYAPGLPRLVVRVEADPEIHQTIAAAVAEFRRDLADMVKTIKGKY